MDGVTHFDMGPHISVPFLLVVVANMACEALGCSVKEDNGVTDDMGTPII